MNQTCARARLILSFVACMAGAGQSLAADTNPPAVSLSAPAAGATVRATITVRATASDDVGVVGVQFQLDGANLGLEDLTPSYSVSWNTTLAANGPHSLTAIARDATGNVTTSAPVIITVDNQAPTGSVSINGGALATETSAVTLTLAASDNSGAVTQMRFSNSSGASTFSAPEPFATTKAWTLSTGSGTKTVYVKFKDAVGNWSASSTDTIILDTAPPTVSVTSPAQNASLRGTVTVRATASDDSGIAGVQFLLDGTSLGAEDITSAYTVSWNTLTSGNGPHQLSAIARDKTGKMSASPAVSVLVDNVAPTGSIVINSGAAATNSGNVTLTLAAADDSGTVSQMRFSNGSTFGAAEPYATTKAWTLTTGSGNKTVSVQYRDTAGNWSASFSDSIVLDTTAPTISAIAATSNASGTAATVIWATNEQASSQVEYGLSTAYGSLTALDAALLTSHGVSLGGLAPQTLYNYRVRSVDAVGNEAIGPNGTLQTLGTAEPDTTAPTAPPTLSAVGVSSSRVNLSWGAATDNVAVTGYTIFRDGTQRGTTVTTSFADTGLAPTTTYLYTVVAQDAAGNTSLPSPSASATTTAGGDTTPFSFSVYGDSRAGSNCQDNADHINVVNRIVATDPAFVLHVGDMVTGYDSTTNWVSNGRCTTPGQIGSFRDIIVPLSARSPPPGLPTSFFPVIGNHDDDRGDGWYPDPMGGGVCDAFGPALVRQLVPNHTQQPYFRDKTGRNYTIYPDDTFYSRICSKDAAVNDVYSSFFYYSFDYNNSHFVVMRINTDYFDLRASNSVCAPENEDNYDTCYNIHQLHWLQDDLARARANPDIKHIFGFLHAPVFTTAQDHQATSSWRYVAQEFSKVKGAVVFSGHNHLYERTVPIYSTAESPGGVRDDVNGTVYVVTGGGGSPLHGFNAPAWFDVIQNAVKHFVTVTVNGDQVSVTATDLNGNVIDSFGF